MAESEFLFNNPSESEVIQTECAIVGVYSRKTKVARIALEGLIELNHRGQESAGIGVSNGDRFQVVKDNGLASVVFGFTHSLPSLPNAFIAVGQDRYSTSGTLSDAQPFDDDENFLFVHNGNLTNISRLGAKYGIPPEINGARSDSRIALAMMSNLRGTEREKIIGAIKEFEGAFCFAIATKDKLFAARDPLGFRPLSLGKLNDDSGYVIASESVAFSAMDATFVRDVLPGEILQIDKNGLTTIHLDRRSRLARCIFEPAYFARPDGEIYGIPVALFRKRQGEKLALYLPDDIDLIMPVPRSGIQAAIGAAATETARARGIPYADGLYTNPYRDVLKGSRTFIQPDGRDLAATNKYSANKYVVDGMRIAVVDDTIVRGSFRLVAQKLRNAGAEKIHGLIAFPPIKHKCPYGVDFGNGDLLANRIPDLDKRREYLFLDSLSYLSYAEIVECAVGNQVEITDETVFEAHDFCGACVTGRYPTEIDGIIDKTL